MKPNVKTCCGARWDGNRLENYPSCGQLFDDGISLDKLSTRAKRVILALGVRTIGELEEATKDGRIAEADGSGVKTYGEIHRYLQESGIFLDWLPNYKPSKLVALIKPGPSMLRDIAVGDCLNIFNQITPEGISDIDPKGLIGVRRAWETGRAISESIGSA